MFWSKNKKKIGILLQTSVYYLKMGFKGVYTARTCFPDVYLINVNEYNLYSLTALKMIINIYIFKEDFYIMSRGFYNDIRNCDKLSR